MNWPSVRSLRAAVLLCLILAAGELGTVPAAAGAGARTLAAAKELVVAAVGNWGQPDRLTWQGLELAAREINQSGGILGKPVKLWRKEAPDDPRQAIRQAQEIADNPDTALAILFTRKAETLQYSTVLAYFDVLTFFTRESTPFLEVNLPLLFRLCPSDLDELVHLARFCLYAGIKRIALVVGSGESDRIHANALETEVRARGMRIAARIGCDMHTTEGGFRRGLAELQANSQFDAIFFSGPAFQAVKLLKAAAAQGIEQPFIGGSQWDTPELAAVADKDRTSVYLVTPFAPDFAGTPARRFVDAYRQAYGESPDAQAAINYNALHLYALAARVTGSAAPDKVMATLTKKLRWNGPFGDVRLNDLGELVSPPLYIKRFAKGSFQILDFEYPKHWH